MFFSPYLNKAHEAELQRGLRGCEEVAETGSDRKEQRRPGAGAVGSGGEPFPADLRSRCYTGNGGKT